MPDAALLSDVTGTVALDDAAAVAAAVERILALSPDGEAFDSEQLHAGFAFVARAFTGGHPDWLACDMPYHDLRHSLDAALVMARLVDGYRSDGGALGPDLGVAAVLLALLHDTGFLRAAHEAALCGPQLAATHEARSVAFAGAYLRSTPLARHAELAPLILTTRVAVAPATVLDGREEAETAIGRMLGSADLLCQLADPRYLARCYHHLYPELVIGGGDRTRKADGQVEILFRDARDLVARTPGFHDHVVHPRISESLGNVARHLGTHFQGRDPYAAAIRDNVAQCRRIVADDRWDLIGEPPPTTTRSLDPAYTSR